MVNTTASDTGIAGMIGNYYVKVFERRLEANLVYDKWAEQRPIPRNSGATIVWHQLNNVAIGYDITDGDTPAASAVSARKISATLSYKGDLKAITDQVDLTAVCPVVKETVDAMGYGAALTLDAFVADKIGFGSATSTGVTFAASATYPSVFSQGFPVYEANSDTVYWPNSTTNIATSLQNGFFSTITTIAHVRGAVTKLKQIDVMPFDDGLYRGVIDPLVSDFIRRDSSFATWMQFKYPDMMQKGELGVIERVRFQESSKAMKSPIAASAWSATALTNGGSVIGTLIFGKGAYGVTKLGGKDYEVNVLPTSMKDKSDPLGQRALVSYKFACAAKILNPSCGIILAYLKTN